MSFPVLAFAAPVTHCKPDAKVFFSCVADKKTVSLCGQSTPSGLASLTYRYGPPGQLENEYSATPANGKNFFGTVEPDSPRAEIREIWFDLGDFRDLRTSCLGGDCPFGGGLAVLKHGKVLSSRRCAAGPDSLTAFSSDLVEFGDEAEGSKFHTPLLKLDDYTNKIERLYPIPKSVYP